MGDYGSALLITVVAFGLLILMSLLFIGLSMGLERLSRIGGRKKEADIAMSSQKKKALIAAAVMGYLEAEGSSAVKKGSTAVKSMKREGRDEKKIQGHPGG